MNRDLGFLQYLEHAQMCQSSHAAAERDSDHCSVQFKGR
jgi:hypothetical protein